MLQREVALTELPSSTEDAARALARLSHPNVIEIYDIDEVAPDDGVVVVTERTAEELQAWLGHTPRPRAAVLRHFIEAGHGLAALHDAGLAHGAFSPSAVVLAGGIAKVSEFGRADENLPSDARDGHAPERVAGGPPTAAADQFSFCASLQAALGEAPRRVAAALSRGLAPDPQARWPNMHALLRELERASARTTKRLLGVLGVASLLAFFVLAFRGWVAQRGQRCSGAAAELAGVWDDERRVEVEAAILGVDAPYADAVASRVVGELDTYAAGWVAMHKDACEATSVRGEQPPLHMDLRMTCLRSMGAELAAAVDVLAEADRAVVRNADKLTTSLPPLSRCADVTALLADGAATTPEDLAATESARAQLAVARAMRVAGKPRLARSALAEAEALAADVAGPLQATLAFERGRVEEALGNPAAADAALQRALTLAVTWKRRSILAAAATRLIFVVGYLQSRFEEGLQYRELAEAATGDDAEKLGWLAAHAAAVLHAQGKHAEASVLGQRALAFAEAARGPVHRDVAMARMNLANGLLVAGRYDNAVEEYTAALETFETALGPDHPDAAFARTNYARALHARGELATAEAQARRALKAQQAALGDDSLEAASTSGFLGTLAAERGDYGGAVAAHRFAVGVRQAWLAEDHPDVAGSLNNLGTALAGLGKHAEAETVLRQAYRAFASRLGPAHFRAAGVRLNLAAVAEAQGKSDEAEVELRDAVAAFEQHLGPEHPHVATARVQLADFLLRQDKPTEALSLANAAWTVHQREDVSDRVRDETRRVRAAALAATRVR